MDAWAEGRNAIDLRSALSQPTEVRMHHARVRVVIAKADTAINYSDPSVCLDGQAVHADFPEAAEGNELDGAHAIVCPRPSLDRA